MRPERMACGSIGGNTELVSKWFLMQRWMSGIIWGPAFFPKKTWELNGIDTSFHFIWRSWNGNLFFFAGYQRSCWNVRWGWGIAHWMRYLSWWFIMTPVVHFSNGIWSEMNVEYGNGRLLQWHFPLKNRPALTCGRPFDSRRMSLNANTKQFKYLKEGCGFPW